jgi:hypothetical protein
MFDLHTPLNPLRGDGYQFWSGIGSGSPLLVPFALWWRRHNCHVHRCWRLQWHVHPKHGHPVCRKHHPAHRHLGS